MAIPLPRASARSVGVGGRRGIRLPTAADVPAVPLLSDPGVQVPAAVPSGLEDFGAGLTDLGRGLQRAAARQQREYDFTRTAETRLEFGKSSMTEFQRLQTEDDPSRPDFMADFEQWLGVARDDQGVLTGGGRVDEILGRLPKDVSPEARGRLRLKLIGDAQSLARQAGRISLTASAKRAEDAYQAIANRAVDQASSDPSALAGILDDLGDELNQFVGALTPDQERDAISAARVGAINAAVRGLIDAGDPATAAALIRKHAEDLTDKQQKALRSAAKVARGKIMLDNVLTFVERQPDFTTGYAKLLLGEFDDPALKIQYDALPASERLKLQSTVLNTISERRALLKNREDDDESAAKLLTDELKRELYLEKDPARRIQLFGQIQRAGTETPESEQKLLDFILGRAGFSPFPNPSLEAEFMRDLQEGTNVGPDDIRAAQSQLTQPEFTRVMARSRSLQNTALRDSFALIDREFGLPPGNVFPTQDQVELSAELEPLKADLQRFLEDNPDASVGEIREQRDGILKEARGKVKEALDARTLERIERTAEAIPGFDAGDPEKSLKALIAAGKLEADSTQARQMSNAIRAARKRGLLK